MQLAREMVHLARHNAMEGQPNWPDGKWRHLTKLRLLELKRADVSIVGQAADQAAELEEGQFDARFNGHTKRIGVRRACAARPVSRRAEPVDAALLEWVGDGFLTSVRNIVGVCNRTLR